MYFLNMLNIFTCVGILLQPYTITSHSHGKTYKEETCVEIIEVKSKTEKHKIKENKKKQKINLN